MLKCYGGKNILATSFLVGTCESKSLIRLGINQNFKICMDLFLKQSERNGVRLLNASLKNSHNLVKLNQTDKAAKISNGTTVIFNSTASAIMLLTSWTERWSNSNLKWEKLQVMLQTQNLVSRLEWNVLSLKVYSHSRCDCALTQPVL